MKSYTLENEEAGINIINGIEYIKIKHRKRAYTLASAHVRDCDEERDFDFNAFTRKAKPNLIIFLKYNHNYGLNITQAFSVSQLNPSIHHFR